jgi:hypothetical protein
MQYLLSKNFGLRSALVVEDTSSLARKKSSLQAAKQSQQQSSLSSKAVSAAKQLRKDEPKHRDI